MTFALRGYGPSLQDSPEFCLYFTLLDMRNYEQLHYQEGCERLYRVTWYGGSSNQLHFQKWGIVANPSRSAFSAAFDGEPEWIDMYCRTMMDVPTRVKELWQEMRDYYSYCLEMEAYRVFN